MICYIYNYMYIYMCMHTKTCTHMHTHTHTHTHTYTHTHAHSHAHVHTHTHTHTRTHTHTHTYTIITDTQLGLKDYDNSSRMAVVLTSQWLTFRHLPGGLRLRRWLLLGVGGCSRGCLFFLKQTHHPSLLGALALNELDPPLL